MCVPAVFTGYRLSREPGGSGRDNDRPPHRLLVILVTNILHNITLFADNASYTTVTSITHQPNNPWTKRATNNSF
jgi:hypothetical protein